MGMMGSMFLTPIFAQTFLGLDATQTGYLFMPMAFVVVIASPLGGSLTGKVQPRFVIATSTLIAAIGLFWFSFLDPRSTSMDIIIPLVIMAFGLGFGMAQRTNIIASVVPKHEIGIASSILALARNIAGAFGIAIFGTILNNATYSHVIELSRKSTLHSTNPLDYSTFVGLITLKAQVYAYSTVFITSAVIAFIGAIAAMSIKIKKEDMVQEEVPVE